MDNNSFVNTFLLLGRTGVGKSKLAKILSEDESIKIGETFLPETKIPKCYNCEYNYENDSFKYSIIDTPGYDDLNGNDKTIFRHIDNFLTSRVYKIKGIVLLYSF
jgi:GTP-binding protein EngB required for normal cell division